MPWGTRVSTGPMLVSMLFFIYKNEKTASHMPVSCLSLLIFSASMIQIINKIN